MLVGLLLAERARDVEKVTFEFPTFLPGNRTVLLDLYINEDDRPSLIFTHDSPW